VAIPEGLQEAYRIMGLSLPTQTGRSVIDVADSEVALYLAADREVLRELVASDPTRWPTSFTIKEFARAVNNSALDARLEEIRRDAHVGRRASDLLAPSITDDVADPGLYASPEAYLAMARELERLASVIAPVLAT
jgi:protein-tyrosine-phosphatase